MCKIAFYTVGDASLPSTWFRVIQYFEKLRESGIQVTHFDLPPVRGGRFKKILGILRQYFRRWRQLGKARQFDLLLIQKGLLPARVRGLVRRLWSQGVPYVVDLDDAIYVSPPVLLPGPLRWLQELDEPLQLFKRAKCVIAGNRFLAEFVNRYRNHVRVIPTPIDTETYTVRQKEKDLKPVIGWSGSTASNFYFNDLIPALNVLVSKYDFTLLIISNDLRNIDQERLKGVRLTFIPWSKEREVEDLQKIDIGLMPLRADEWSRGKCGLKALQYMALGVPAVCSPVGVNQEIIQEGVNGFLARTPEEWIQKLGLLIENEALRKEMGKEARKTVEERYSVKVNAPKLIRLIEEVLRDDESQG